MPESFTNLALGVFEGRGCLESGPEVVQFAVVLGVGFEFVQKVSIAPTICWVAGNTPHYRALEQASDGRVFEYCC